jgi:hypothetical protein
MKVLRLALALVFMGVILGGCAPGLPPVGNYATVSGQVVDAATSQGIAGATVSVNGGVLTAVTDAGGNFRVAPVPTGDWDYTVFAQGYSSTGLITSVAPLSPGEQRIITITLTRGS